eukprot:8339527-Lingulodinium_polyedra.AAC.1
MYVNATTGRCGANLSLAGLMVWNSDTRNSKHPNGDCPNMKIWDPKGRAKPKSPGPQQNGACG